VLKLASIVTTTGLKIGKNMNAAKKSQSGMALVTVLIFSAIAMIVVVTGISLVTITTQSSREFLQGQEALHITESGVENALMRLLRDPTYSGEVLTVGEGTATIVVDQFNGDRTITVTGEVGSAIRQIEVQSMDESGITSVVSWKEVF
jgi:Tfp pilus assembly protein PilV